VDEDGATASPRTVEWSTRYLTVVQDEQSPRAQRAEENDFA